MRLRHALPALRGLPALGVLVASALVVAGLGPLPAASATGVPATVTQTFAYSASTQTFTVPAGSPG